MDFSIKLCFFAVTPLYPNPDQIALVIQKQENTFVWVDSCKIYAQLLAGRKIVRPSERFKIIRRIATQRYPANTAF